MPGQGLPWERTCVSGRLMHPQPRVPSTGSYQSVPQPQTGLLEARGKWGVRGASKGEEQLCGLRY